MAVFASLQTLQSAGLGIERHLLRTLYRIENENSRNRLLSLMNTEGNKPSILLLVDGFNELNGDTSYRYAAELKRLSQNPGLQIIVSSRLDFLRNYGMAHFQMLRTCDLRDPQIRTLFGEERWTDILGKRHCPGEQHPDAKPDDRRRGPADGPCCGDRLHGRGLSHAGDR